MAATKHVPAEVAVRVAEEVELLSEQFVAEPPVTIANVGTPEPVPPFVENDGVAVNAVPE